jgi:hypothetical protein
MRGRLSRRLGFMAGLSGARSPGTLRQALLGSRDFISLRPDLRKGRRPSNRAIKQSSPQVRTTVFEAPDDQALCTFHWEQPRLGRAIFTFRFSRRAASVLVEIG